MSARLSVLQTTREVTRAVGKLCSGRSLRRSKVAALARSLLGVVLAVVTVGPRLALCLGGSSGSTRLGELLLETAWRNGSLAGTVGMDIASGGVGDIIVVGLQVSLTGVLLHGLPALAVVQLHPIVLAIFNLATILQCLSEQIAQVVVVGSVLKAEVANV